MGAFRDHGATVLMVSHSIATVQALCQRAMWLDHGTVRALGPASEVAAQYHQSNS
jgi:ABC-type polysaccharide/polyol phosphate transport system ATPase subunit